MMKEKIRIVEALPEQSAIIARFQKAMAYETENLELDENTLKAGVERVFDDPAKGKYYIALEADEVVASMLTTPEWSDWRNGTVLWLQSVYVVPSHRQKGIFRLMYAHIKNKVLHSEKLMGIRLYVEKSNATAQKVYRNMGMTGEHYQLFEWMP